MCQCRCLYNLGITTTIQQQNEEMDKKTAEVWTLLNKSGLECAVLKGQGVAHYYKHRDESLERIHSVCCDRAVILTFG